MLNVPSGSDSSTLSPEVPPMFILSEYVAHSEEVTDHVLELNNVVITPEKMLFRDAFEGKKYHQKITIQNCGTCPVFIRICPASSYAFDIKPLVRGEHLSSGLSIIRYVSYTYMRATAVPFAWIPIHINKQELQYKLIVSLSEVLITAIPHQIDFGTINAGHSAAVRMLSLRNDGSKGTRFAIDLRRNEIELLVEPTKGIIHPHETVTFRVECLGTTEGSFTREFWVNCETPLRILITGTIIAPQLLSFNANKTREFTLVDFPKTYFGTHCIKMLIIKNFGVMPAIYCTVAELTDKSVDLDDAHLYKTDYLNFQIEPIQGALLPQEARIFQFRYTPIKETRKGKHGRYENNSFCCVRVVHIPCIDWNQIEIPVNITIQDQDSSSRYPAVEDKISLGSEFLSLEEESSLLKFEDEIMRPENPLALSRVIRVLLYGEAEQAGIAIRPDSLNLLEIPNNQSVTRELLLINQSNSLPIIFNYKKVCFINVEPKSGLLPPSGKLEVGVTITPAKIGKVKTKIAFDLLFFNRPKSSNDYVVVGHSEIPLTFDVPSVPAILKPKFNMGITPKYIKEVGFLTDDVRFNTPIEMPRATLVKEVKKTLRNNDSDLIAFPNDRPKSLRPWKTTTKCRTICAGILRAVSTSPDTYELSKSKTDLKHTEYSYYKKYTRETAERIRKLQHLTKQSFSDYEISNKKLLLLNDGQKPKCIVFKHEKLKIGWFIPLCPVQLNLVKVHPLYIKLDKMAPNTSASRIVTINNKNEFPIRIFAKSRKSVIDFPGGDHKILKPFKEIEIEMTYNSCSIAGRYSVIIDFIVNDSHTFTVPVSVDVIPKCVKFSCEDIVFESNGCPYKYVDIFNPVNVPVAFNWKIPDCCFVFEPTLAIIPARHHITCMVTYIASHSAPAGADATLCSENRRPQTINVSVNLIPPKIALGSSKIELNDIPLNLPLKSTNTLKNLGEEIVTFVVLNPEPMKGILITPAEGIFHGNAEQIFTINVKIQACIKFTCLIEIEVQRIKVIKFQISGNVVYPEIVIKPKTMQLRKIKPNSFERQVFCIINKSTTNVTLEFRLEDYLEYTILETHDFDVRLMPIKEIELEAKEQKELYLHFNPVGAASYGFYLPIVINGILGPASLSMPNSDKPLFYTESYERDYIECSNATSIPMPKTLSLISVRSCVVGDMLRFSKLHLNFKYFPAPTFTSETYIDLKIWNASKDTCQFCIRTDELRPPFTLTYLTGNEIETLSYSIVCLLGPGEDVTLQAEFVPNFPGTFYIRLPVYVRHYLDGSVFNYLSFNGWFPNPTISASEERICLEPVPLKCETVYTFYLKNEYHSSNCDISSESDSNELRINFTRESTSEESERSEQIRVVLHCCLTTSKFIDCRIRFFCTCDAECFVNVKGCSDKCTVTTHAFVRSYTKALCNQLPQDSTRSSLSLQIGAQLPLKPRKSQESFEECKGTRLTLPSTTNVLEFNINYNETSFPLFPDEHDETEYAKYMRTTVSVLEEWLFRQGFYGKNYYKIPEGIATGPAVKKSEKAVPNKKKIEPLIVLKYVELLTSLVGPQINNYIPIRKIPEEDIHRVNYMYNVYNSAKEFVIKQGGFLPNIFPENLLLYNDYVIFMKSVYPYRPEYLEADIPELLDEQKFYLISKQSWMDLLLQTYKVFVLARIRMPQSQTEIGSNESRIGTLGSSPIFSSSPTQTSISLPTENFIKKPSLGENTFDSREFNGNILNDFSFKIVDDIAFWQELTIKKPQNSNVFNESEIILLHWLEYHFIRQREILWGPNGYNPNEDVPVERNVRFFNDDLSDGLVLVAITAVYCPYLIPHLLDIYSNPISTEQTFHNASKLLQSWSMINLSFILTPQQIINPNGLEMLMLVNYLYQVLPNFYPNNTICFKTGLSTSCSENIVLENLSDFPIRYTVIFFRNKNKLFSVPNPVITIRPHQKVKIPVKFDAIKLAIENVTMVLNGETPKYNYAKSMAFTLIGEPFPSYSTTTVTIPAPLYQLLEITINIQSPYPGENTYDIYYSTEEPNNIKTCKIISWASEIYRKIPRRICSNANRLEFNEEGIGNFDLTICCATTIEKEYWIIFRNPTVGDFTVKLITIPDTETKTYISVPVELPNAFKTFHCSCKDSENLVINKRCPRSITIRIPCRNDVLWDAVKELVMKVSNETDLSFWKEYIGTNVGIKIGKWMVDAEATKTSYDMSEICNSTVTYKIIFEDASSKISLPPSTTIENVHSRDYHEITMHIGSSTGRPTDFDFTMESENGIELRHYTVHFLTKKEYNNEMQLVNVQ